MIAFDINVVVQLLVADDADQHARAVEAVHAAEREGERVFLSVPVVCETWWVLSRSYRVPRAKAVEALSRLVEDSRFEIERRDEIAAALERTARGKGELPDHLIGAIGLTAGARATLTFDRSLRREPGFELL